MIALLLAAAVAAASPAPAAQMPQSPQLPQNCSKATAFTGTICTPQGGARHPAILLLGGSEGGDIMAYSAPRFAQAGYVAASVAYFGLPGLPQTLEEIPVETVGKALDAIVARSDVDPNRIAILGGSKGGELALLAASVYPQIHAVVADVPSPFAWQGIPRGPAAPRSSWTYRGKPLPYVPFSSRMGELFAAAFSSNGPLDVRAGYDAAMEVNGAMIPAAMFHLENVRGPILFLAADDDQVWDSVAQSQIGMQYLKAHQHPYDDLYLHYPGAGHLFLFATQQMPFTQVPMGGGVTMLLGGSAQANVQAAQQAWPRIMSFLSSAL